MEELSSKSHGDSEGNILLKTETRFVRNGALERPVTVEFFSRFDLEKELLSQDQVRILSGPHQSEYIVIRSKDIEHGRPKFELRSNDLPQDPEMTDFAVYPLYAGQPRYLEVNKKSTFGRLPNNTWNMGNTEMLDSAKPIDLYPRSIELWKNVM